VDAADAESFCKSQGIVFFETSAKVGLPQWTDRPTASSFHTEDAPLSLVLSRSHVHCATIPLHALPPPLHPFLHDIVQNDTNVAEAFRAVIRLMRKAEAGKNGGGGGGSGGGGCCVVM
jgi:hypothetical protein